LFSECLGTSAAMTLDVYADLFDDDLTGVARRLDENVGTGPLIGPGSREKQSSTGANRAAVRNPRSSRFYPSSTDTTDVTRWMAKSRTRLAAGSNAINWPPRTLIGATTRWVATPAGSTYPITTEV